MKIRTGFVSNSSTSSFIVWGTYVSNEETAELGDSDFIDKIYEAGLKYGYDNEGDRMVGLSPADMKDDQTLLEFKQSIVDTLKKLGVVVAVTSLEYIEEIIVS